MHQKTNDVLAALAEVQKAFYKKPFKGKGEYEGLIEAIAQAELVTHRRMCELTAEGLRQNLHLIDLVLVLQGNKNCRYLRWRNAARTKMGDVLYQSALCHPAVPHPMMRAVMRLEAEKIAQNMLAKMLNAQKRIAKTALDEILALDGVSRDVQQQRGVIL